MSGLDELHVAFVELDEDRTLDLTRELLERQVAAPSAILTTCQQALRVVGERYERQEYFLSALIMAGELFKEVLDLVQPTGEPLLSSDEPVGTAVIGTVAGDIHDIGKNMFITSLQSFGFRVIDLGVDVAPAKFLEEVRRSRPDIVGLSGLIALAVENMKQTVELLRAYEHELGYRLPIVLGGAVVNGRVCRYCGADSWSTDAMEGVRIFQRLVQHQSRAAGR
ncbi:MAG: cobalamin-dependent protein [Thermoleophilia bacterium]|nr:cobalamin-dependent protein [Thermoleophilia bacterium]